MATFDFVSFIIGLLLGMIIMLLIVWIAYFTRSFVFALCPVQSRPCGGADYYNDPGDALANNPNISVSDILFLNSENQLFYQRIPKNTDCIPGANQTVLITYPQYCMFSASGGTGAVWKESSFNSNIYRPVGFPGPTITTEGNCEPAPGSPVTNGVPLVRWDPNAIS